LLISTIEANASDVFDLFLETIKDSDFLKFFSIKKNTSSYYMNLLSIALLKSASLNLSSLGMSSEDYRKEMENIRKIILYIINKTKDFGKDFTGLNPMTIAFLTGQLDQVKYLNKKGISISEGFLWETAVSLKDVLKELNFDKTLRYFEKNSSCKMIF